MKRLKTLFFFLVLIQASLYCQTGSSQYPQKIIINGDTLVGITVDHVRKLNFVFIKNDFLKEMNDTLDAQNAKYKALSSKYKQLNTEYESAMGFRKAVIAEQDTIIAGYKKRETKNERKIKFLKLQRNVIAGIAVLGIGYYRLVYVR